MIHPSYCEDLCVALPSINAKAPAEPTFDSELTASLRPAHICIRDSCDRATFVFFGVCSWNPTKVHFSLWRETGRTLRLDVQTYARVCSQNQANKRSEMKTTERVILQLRFFLRCHRGELAVV